MMIADNVRVLQDHIAAACARVQRDPAQVTLLAVSKTNPPEAIMEAVEAGLQHFGENRVEEAETKIPLVNQLSPRPITWHMIGHIQSRKARDVVPLFQVVESVDSIKLAGKLSASAVEAGVMLRVLLEVNVSGEAAKHGLDAHDWAENAAIKARLWDDVGQIVKLPGLVVSGLMTMAPIAEDAEAVRPVFRSLAALRDALADDFRMPLPELSMGMSDDYLVAIEEGATIVRIGRAIFGDRKTF